MTENPAVKRIRVAMAFAGIKHQIELADRIGIGRSIMSDVLNSRRPISAKMAIRLHRVLGDHISPPETLLKEQIPWQLDRAAQALGLDDERG